MQNVNTVQNWVVVQFEFKLHHYPELLTLEKRDAESAVFNQRRSELHYVRSMAVRFDGPNYPHVVSKMGENRSKRGLLTSLRLDYGFVGASNKA
jgi:hypothetical protein